MRFDAAVTFVGPPAAAFRLTGPTGATVGLTVALSGGGAVPTVAVLTFTGAGLNGASLADGYYQFSVLSNQVKNAAGNFLEGSDSTTPGGDYTLAGGLFRYLGDADGDGAVDGNDLAFMAQAFNSVEGDANYRWWLDLDGDGAVDGNDLALFAQRFNTVL